MKKTFTVRLTLEDGTVYTGKSFGAAIPAHKIIRQKVPDDILLTAPYNQLCLQ